MSSAHKDFESFANHWRYDLTTDENGFYQDSITQRVFDAWSCRSDRIAELEREKAELVARMVELNNLHSDLTNADMVLDDGEHSGYLITNEQIDGMERLLSADAQCLNQIKAEVVIEAIDAHKNNVMTFDFNTAIRVTDLIQYANKLRSDL